MTDQRTDLEPGAADLCALGARELIAGLAARRWTSEQLTAAFLDRIRAREATHAVAFTYDEQAIEEAREIDRRRARGEEVGALGGLPFTIKDAMRIRDRRTTYGLSHYKRYRPGGDSEVVRVLRESGAVILGRTAVPTGSFDWNTRNQVYAECVNPLDASRTPGGSSGGAAAALALGLTPLELGTDIAGSVRYPAHCCGVFAVRTTDGWLPSSDMGPEGLPGFEHFGVFGPMARSIDDLQILLELLGRKFPRPAPARERSRSVAVYDSLLIACDEATASVMQGLRRSLASAGYDVRDARPDLDYERLYVDWCLIVGYEYMQSMPRWLIWGFVKRLAMDVTVLKKLGKGAMRAGILAGAALSHADYEQALERLQQARAVVDEFFREHDAWVLPCSPSPALQLVDCGKQVSTPSGPVDYSRYLGAYLLPTALLGTPAVAFPAGDDGRGLPIGVQVHGARFTDLELVAEVARWPIVREVRPIDAARPAAPARS